MDPEVLRADAERIRERGYALSEQDVSIGISAIGVPVLRDDGTAAACVSIGGLTRAFGTDPERFAPALEEAAAFLSRGLGQEST